MNIATIAVSGVQAITETCAVIPAGIVGAGVAIRFTDSRWEGLTKIAVFRGCETRDVTITGETVVIPHETVAREDHTLELGIYGVDTRQNLVIPTLWTTVGVTRAAADPSGDTLGADCPADDGTGKPGQNPEGPVSGGKSRTDHPSAGGALPGGSLRRDPGLGRGAGRNPGRPVERSKQWI